MLLERIAYWSPSENIRFHVPIGVNEVFYYLRHSMMKISGEDPQPAQGRDNNVGL